MKNGVLNVHETPDAVAALTGMRMAEVSNDEAAPAPANQQPREGMEQLAESDFFADLLIVDTSEPPAVS